MSARANYVVDQVAASKLAPIIDMARVKFAEDARLKKRLAATGTTLAVYMGMTHC